MHTLTLDPAAGTCALLVTHYIISAACKRTSIARYLANVFPFLRDRNDGAGGSGGAGSSHRNSSNQSKSSALPGSSSANGVQRDGSEGAEGGVNGTVARTQQALKPPANAQEVQQGLEQAAGQAQRAAGQRTAAARRTAGRAGSAGSGAATKAGKKAANAKKRPGLGARLFGTRKPSVRCGLRIALASSSDF